MGCNLQGERVVLRAVEAEDVEFLYGVENDLDNWGVSGTTLPFSRYIIERFVESQREDFLTTRQLRFIITTLTGESIGTLDLFEYDPMNHRAGVGIFIVEPCRGQGFGGDALRLLHRYAASVLQLHQLWCGVEASNEGSLRLFESVGYSVVGHKRDWIWRASEYHDEVMLQRLLD